jgi:hypothetical protein
VSARVPPDRGLTGLGLVLQLGGTVGAALALGGGFAAFTTAIAARSRWPGGAGGSAIWLLLLAVITVARAWAQRAAGTSLLYGEGPPLAGVRRYALMAIAHTALGLTWAVATQGLGPRAAVALALALLAWPAVMLAIATAPWHRAHRAGLPPTPDRGFEGAAILMVTLGALGAMSMVFVLLALLGRPTATWVGAPMAFLVLSAIALLVRSLLHMAAGVRGLAEVHLDRAVASVSTYASAGVTTAIAVGALLLLLAAVGGVGRQGVPVATTAVLLLLAWPLLIRRFFAERQFADLVAHGGEPGAHARAPDHGLTTLGYFVLALAVAGVSLLLLRLVVLPGGVPWAAVGLGAPAMTPPGGLSPWWGLLPLVFMLGTAIELVRQGAAMLILALGWAVAALALALVDIRLVLQAAPRGGVMAHAVVVLPTLTTLVLPLVCAVLVVRRAAAR